MKKENVKGMPAGLVTALLDNKEVRILEISPEGMKIRIDEELKNKPVVMVAFYVFDEYKYDEISIKDYCIYEKKENDFYFTYEFQINNDEYKSKVRNIIKDYSKYVTIKNYSEENEFSEEMVGYPAQLDYEFYDFYSDEKRKWIMNLKYENFDEHLLDKIEMAVVINNDILYDKYLSKNIKEFMNDYLVNNYADSHELLKKEVSRVYIGNEFCHNLFPDLNILIEMLNKAEKEKLDITLSFTYMRDCYIEKTRKILNSIYNWCKENNTIIEIIINDWGMLKLIHDKDDYFKPILGSLLNKRKKDPRYIYKKGYKQNKDMMAKNSLNSRLFVNFLKENNIERYEYENCGYRMEIANGHHSLHLPFYMTNTSQYCTTYAMCRNLDRGKQIFVEHCPKYCTDYVFSYPKHLKMVGRYNSLFSFDDTILKESKELEYYIKNGIDRIVLNFI